MKAVVGGRIMTITHGEIPAGVMLFENGKISKVDNGLTVPEGAEIIDAAGKWVVPGIIDCHTHIGARGFMEGSSPVVPATRAIDAVDLNDPAWQDAVEGGVTAVITTPGHNNFAGTSICLKTAGTSFKQRILRENAGLKMGWAKDMDRPSLGLPYARTQMGVAGIFRLTLTACQNYMVRRQKGDVPEDLAMEVIAQLLRREIPARIHIFTPIEIQALFRVADEYGFDFTIEHGFEAYLIADEVARRGIPVIYGPLGDDARRHKLFPFRGKHGCALLQRAGVLVGLQTDHPDESIKGLRCYAGMMLRWTDLTADEIMRMLTINSATIAGPMVAARLGSLEAGKDADFAVYSGHPLSVQSRVEQVFIDGQRVWDGEKLL